MLQSDDTAPPGHVYTFYSYKGGTGRSMALANVGCLMAQAGHRVLVVDWDLEAPGLEKYLAHVNRDVLEQRRRTPGIVDLITDWLPARRTWRATYDDWLSLDGVRNAARETFRKAQKDLLAHAGVSESARAELTRTRDAAEAEWRRLDETLAARHPSGSPAPAASNWQSAVISVTSFANGGVLDFISAGRDDDTYPARVNGLRWDELFNKHDLGLMLESLRDQWRDTYDFVLVDSRTGISDIEGICTVLLPDSLVLLFTTMEQSIEGVIEVWQHAVKQRARLPVPRGRLLALPLPSRDEIDRENRLASDWHVRYAAAFEKIYREWLPEQVEPIDVVKYLALPYVAVWSFGESLPVVQNQADIGNPRSINAAYDRIAGLLANRLSWQQPARGNTHLGLVKALPGQSPTRTAFDPSASTAPSRAADDLVNEPSSAARYADIAAQSSLAGPLEPLPVSAADPASIPSSTQRSQSGELRGWVSRLYSPVVLLAVALIAVLTFSYRSSQRAATAVADETKRLQQELSATKQELGETSQRAADLQKTLAMNETTQAVEQLRGEQNRVLDQLRADHAKVVDQLRAEQNKTYTDLLKAQSERDKYASTAEVAKSNSARLSKEVEQLNKTIDRLNRELTQVRRSNTLRKGAGTETGY